MKYPIRDQELRELADWIAKRAVAARELSDRPNEDLEIYCAEFDRVIGWFADTNALRHE